MDNSKIYIWRDIKTNSPICTMEEAMSFIKSSQINNQLCVINTSVVNGFQDKLSQIILMEYGENQNLLFTKEKIESINEFAGTYKLDARLENTICIFIHLLNHILASKYTENKESENLNKEIDGFNKNIEIMNKVLEKYCKGYIPTGESKKVNYELQCISFDFSDDKSIKITDPLTISYIMNCIRENFEPGIQFPSEILQETVTKHKHSIAQDIFTFLTSPNNYWNGDTQNTAYQIIAHIFELAGDEKVNHERVKTWIMRARNTAKKL